MTLDAAWPLPTRRVALAARRSAALYSGGVAAVCFPVFLHSVTLGTDHLATFAIVAVTATMAVVAWRCAPPRWFVLLDLGVTTAFYVLARSGASAIGTPTAGILPAYLTIVIVVLAPRHRVLLGVIVAVPVIAAELVRTVSLDTLEAIGPGVATAFACLLFFPIVERTEVQVNLAIAAQARAARRRAGQEARLDAHRTAQGVLHDDVLAALRTIAMGKTDEDETVREVRSAWLSLSNAERPLSGTDLPAQLRGLTVTGVTTQVLAPPQVQRVPARVASAITDASRECLRNVSRHAGVREAIIRIDDDGAGAITVYVTDRGRGFDPRRLRASHGLSHSVRERMREVGGGASWTSRQGGGPGSGTTVRLTWRAQVPVSSDATPDPPLPDALEDKGGADPGELHLAIGDSRPAVAAMIGPFVALTLTWCLVGMLGDQPRWLGAWAIAITALGAVSMRLGESPAGRVCLDVLVVIAGAGVATFLLGAPAGVLETGAAWPISLASATMAVGASWRPLWWSLGGALALVVLVGAFAIATDPAHSPTALVPAAPALMSCCWPALVGVTLRTVMVLIGRRENEIATQTRTELARAHAAYRRRMLLDERLEHFRHLVEPVLGSVAHGHRSALDAPVRDEARLVEQVARAELRLPWLTTAAVTRAMRAALTAGVEIAVRATSEVHHAPPMAAPLLEAALSLDVWPRSVILTVPSPDSPVSIVVEVAHARDLPVFQRALERDGVGVRTMGGVLIGQALERSVPEVRFPDAALTDSAPAPG